MDENLKKANELVREASGNVTGNDKLACFIYLLGRDKLPLGEIEQILLNLEVDTQKDTDPEYIYTNGWLAEYAKNVAERLTD